MKILAVMVRYQISLSDSPAYQGLRNAMTLQPDLARNYTVMIWDNSPEALANHQLSMPFLYRHSGVNIGVSGAYNGALEYALEHGYSWMLLLDQDTKITCEILFGMLRHCLDLFSRREIAAIAPTIRVDGRVISPVRKRYLSDSGRKYSEGECGIAPGEASAINSGCVMRVASLQNIGGFSSCFWLDYSDLYLFRQLFSHGMKVWRAADVELEHDMAIMDYDRLMTPWRCKSRSFAETAFIDLYGGCIENAIQTLRLLARAIKQRMKYDNPEFSRIAWAQLIYKLRVPRKKRIACWLDEGKKHATQQQSMEIPRHDR